MAAGGRRDEPGSLRDLRETVSTYQREVEEVAQWRSCVYQRQELAQQEQVEDALDRYMRNSALLQELFDVGDDGACGGPMRLFTERAAGAKRLRLATDALRCYSRGRHPDDVLTDDATAGTSLAVAAAVAANGSATPVGQAGGVSTDQERQHASSAGGPAGRDVPGGTTGRDLPGGTAGHDRSAADGFAGQDVADGNRRGHDGSRAVPAVHLGDDGRSATADPASEQCIASSIATASPPLAGQAGAAAIATSATTGGASANATVPQVPPVVVQPVEGASSVEQYDEYATATQRFCRPVAADLEEFAAFLSSSSVLILPPSGGPAPQ